MEYFIQCPKCHLYMFPILSSTQLYYYCSCGYDSRTVKVTYKNVIHKEIHSKGKIKKIKEII